MRKYKTQLEAKVGERNACHAKLLSVIPIIQAALQPFIGRKVLNQGFVGNKKFKRALPSFIGDDQVWIEANRYTIYIRVKTCGLYPDRQGQFGIACYAEQIFSIADLDGFNLKCIEGRIPEFRTDYTTEEVLAVRKDKREADRLLGEANSRLRYFGDYDN